MQVGGFQTSPVNHRRHLQVSEEFFRFLQTALLYNAFCGKNIPFVYF